MGFCKNGASVAGNSLRNRFIHAGRDGIRAIAATTRVAFASRLPHTTGVGPGRILASHWGAWSEGGWACILVHRLAVFKLGQSIVPIGWALVRPAGRHARPRQLSIDQPMLQKYLNFWHFHDPNRLLCYRAFPKGWG